MTGMSRGSINASTGALMSANPIPVEPWTNAEIATVNPMMRNVTSEKLICETP